MGLALRDVEECGCFVAMQMKIPMSVKRILLCCGCNGHPLLQRGPLLLR